MSLMHAKRDTSGFGVIIAVIALVVVLIIALVGVIYPYITQSERVDICGSTTEDVEKKWYEVLVDSLDPSIRGVTELAGQALRDALEFHGSLSNIALLVQHNGHEVSIGRSYLYQMAGRYFVAVGLFLDCSITDQAAQGYEKEVQHNTVKLAVLLALAVSAPGVVSIFASVEFFIDFLFGWQGHGPETPTIAPGPQIQGLESGAMPDSVGNGLNRQWNGYYTP